MNIEFDPKFGWSDIVGIITALVTLGGLYVALRAARQSNELALRSLSTSIRPYVVFNHMKTSTTLLYRKKDGQFIHQHEYQIDVRHFIEDTGILYSIKNIGVGPALIRSVGISATSIDIPKEDKWVADHVHLNLSKDYNFPLMVNAIEPGETIELDILPPFLMNISPVNTTQIVFDVEITYHDLHNNWFKTTQSAYSLLHRLAQPGEYLGTSSGYTQLDITFRNDAKVTEVSPPKKQETPA